MSSSDSIRASFEEASQTLQAFLDSPEILANVRRFADAAALFHGLIAEQPDNADPYPRSQRA